MFRLTIMPIFIVLLCSMQPVLANTTENSIKEDPRHIENWNRFAARLLELNNSLLKHYDIRQSESVGGYANHPDFYRELTSYERLTGRLISRVQWERKHPGRLHSIEVYLYDDKGRLLRDYLAAYLPEHRNAPIQTLINFHRQTDDSRAFRQFDASGNRIYESCKASRNGQAVVMELWEDQLLQQDADTVTQPDYLYCFQDLPTTTGGYINPLMDLPVKNQTRLRLSPLSSVSTSEPGQLQRYIEQLHRQIRQKPDNPSLYMQRAVAYFLLHEFEDSIRDYDRVLNLNPQQSEAYFGRGMARGRAGQIAAGIEDLGIYLKRHPDSSLAYTKRGVRYLWLGDLKHAESDLEHAIRLDPDNAEAHDDLGVILAQRGETEKAIVHFEQTIRLEPSYQKAHHNMAMSLYLEGKQKPALNAINSALKLIPNAQNSLLLKAEILEALGRSGEADMIRSDAEFLPGGNWSEQFSVKN